MVVVNSSFGAKCDWSEHLAHLDWKTLGYAVAIPLAGGMPGAVCHLQLLCVLEPSFQSVDAAAPPTNHDKRIRAPTAYRTIRKPSWTPPNWLFGPVWTALYIMMGYASYLVYQQGGLEKQRWPLTVYGIQLLLNFLWTPLFFKAHKLGLASLDIIGMWLAIVATMAQFRPVIGDITLPLLGPYLLWVSYATALTLWIWRHNPSQAKQKAT